MSGRLICGIEIAVNVRLDQADLNFQYKTGLVICTFYFIGK